MRIVEARARVEGDDYHADIGVVGQRSELGLERRAESRG
jgi:hypothetical protein